MNLPENIYVVVSEFDTNNRQHQKSGISKAIVSETHVDSATKKNAIGHSRRLEQNGCGETKIARLVFSELDQVSPIKSSIGLLASDSKKIDELIGSLHQIAVGRGLDGLPVGNEPALDQARLAILRWVSSL